MKKKNKNIYNLSTLSTLSTYMLSSFFYICKICPVTVTAWLQNLVV